MSAPLHSIVFTIAFALVTPEIQLYNVKCRGVRCHRAAAERDAVTGGQERMKGMSYIIPVNVQGA